jgi:hypothetical protein
MSGGIVQLVATGPQDAWLTGKPEISFFRSNYKRYTHYANSVERQVIQGVPIAGGISTIRFEKKGDLLSYVYFTAKDAFGTSIAQLDWTKVIDKVDLYIGGQIVDTHDIEYMTDIEPVTGAQNFSQRPLNLSSTTFNNQRMSFLPLKFFFCKDWSVCLPLVALQFHDVEIRITWSANLGSSIQNMQGLFITTSAVNTTYTYAPSIASVAAGGLGSIPQSTANVIVSQYATNSNVLANVVLSQVIGPLFPGMLISFPFSNTNYNVYTNIGVVQSFSNAVTVGVSFPFANVSISGSNSSSLNLLSGNVCPMYAPTVSCMVTGPFNNVSGNVIQSPIANISIGQISSPAAGSNILPGMFIYGLPVAGQATVASYNGSNISVVNNFPLSSNVSNTSIPLNSIISFLSNTATPTTTGGAVTNVYKYSDLQYQAWSNFVYLDQGERDWFAKSQHDLLITQVQRVVMGTGATQELALAQPIKFIAFPCTNYNTLYNFGIGSTTATNYQLKTQVNGVDVGDSRHMTHWIDVPQYYNTPFGYSHNNTTANVAIISYCLDTSKLQPTGTLNFSRLDTYRLVVPPSIGANGLLSLAGAINYPVTYLYAVGYNVFRIQNGLGSLLYAN